MGNTKHTPGPWGFKNLPESTHWRIFSETHGGVCQIPADSKNYEEHKANAKLIAEAPELLKLIQWITRVTNNPEIGIKCDAAIKKATE